MLAKAMNVTNFLPYWNSLDSVRRIHSDFEFASIVLFALLALFDVLAHLTDDAKREKLLERIGLVFFGLAVIAELIAYPYGQRNDTLSENIIGSLDEKAERARDAAGTALNNSETANEKADAANGQALEAKGSAEDAGKQALLAGTAAKDASQRAIEADAKAEEERRQEAQLELLVNSRRLTLEQQNSLGSACTGLYGRELTVSSYPLDGEGTALAAQIASSLSSKGFSVITDFGTTISSGGFDFGVLIFGPTEDLDFMNCLSNSFQESSKIEVVVNGARHLPGAIMGGNAIMGGVATIGGGGITPATPLPPGSLVNIKVGIRPVTIRIAK